MKKDSDNGIRLEDTGFYYTISLIEGKYKILILYILSKKGVCRFNELKRAAAGISYKTLSKNLKEMEMDGLISRKEYPQIPPKVEYWLTERGNSLIPVLNQICLWGIQHRKDGPEK